MVVIHQQRIEIILIGASAGGIKALLNLLPHLPSGWQLPIVVVIHLPEQHESRLAEVFQHYLRVPVCVAHDKQTIAPGKVYFAGPAYHLSIERDHSFSLSCEDPVHFSRPSIDMLMTSGADAFGSAAMGILLTGANSDGAEGLATIHARGGLTVVQEPHEAEFPIMPQAALDAHVPDFVLTLAEIRALIISVEKT